MKASISSSATQFHPPILNTQQIHTPYYHRIITKTSSLNTRLAHLPDYNALLIPKPISKPKPSIAAPIQDTNPRLDTQRNTSADVLRLIDGLGLPVTPDIYASLVAECTQKRDAVQAAQVLAHLKRNRGMVGFVNGSSGLSFLNRILVMLVVCGSLDATHQVFDEMPQRDSISLAIMIAGLVDNKLFHRALDLFVELHGWIMNKEYDLPLQVVLVCVLEACTRLKIISLGKVLHGWMLKMGYSTEPLVATALMEFYGKCRCLSDANFVFFDQIEMADHCGTGIWNVAIVNNCREACFHEVIWLFREMGRAGVKKNDQTFSGVLKACGRANDGRSYGKQVHANAIKLGHDTRTSVICGLVDMYGTLGLLKDARAVFDMVEHEQRNMACWNAMITNFIQHGLHIEALKLLYEMKAAGLKPQQSLIDEVRVACGSENVGMSTSWDSL